jgi:hypothetical protein
MGEPYVGIKPFFFFFFFQWLLHYYFKISPLSRTSPQKGQLLLWGRFGDVRRPLSEKKQKKVK